MSKEQYRERLAQVSFNAERPITGLRVYTSDEQERHAAMAEAVAAQVFRDFWRYLNSRPVSSDLEYAADNRAQKAITQWAAACGIDLGETT